LIQPLINEQYAFIFATIAVALLIPVFFSIFSVFKKRSSEALPSAPKRKIRGELYSGRKAAVVLSVCLVFSVITLTALKAYNERPVVLSEPEEYTLQDGQIYIPLGQVSDEKLHRFAYTTDDGITVRFIVILKGSSSYGVGLDACDICGATGYYEKNGQVICSLCDVVMNKETIGFKGGCNPVPLAYEISDGKMVIKTGDLIAEKKRFK
jgi:uncharacterized membrane protein